MSILGLAICPPLAIGRLGSSDAPLENYELTVPANGFGFRQIAPARTLYVNASTGAISREDTPSSIRFKDGDTIRPVAPFFEVWAYLSGDRFEPLTLTLLHRYGLRPKDIKWNVQVGNIKAFRRTGDEDDKAIATVSLNDHAAHPLEAVAGNFIEGKVLPLGSVRYIRPTSKFPEIRLRFTPGHGLVYGASEKRIEVDEAGVPQLVLDPVVAGRIIYDGSKPGQKWLGWIDAGDAATTNPGQIYAGYDRGADHISWGYLDDECDGIISVELRANGGEALSAFARIGVGPPNFAPDGLPIRTVHDELLQALLGPSVSSDDVSTRDAEDILRRAFETVRLLNTSVMNGNTITGRTAVASAMPSQDSNDTHRLYAPIMASGIVDSRAVLALHESILAALRAGSAPWFVDALRKPEEVGDLSDAGRRKMPAMMRGADARYLTLTRRQIDTIAKIAQSALFQEPSATRLRPRNGTAKRATSTLEMRGAGNPPASHPSSAISNCFPGLEFDFRNIWRRMFVGIVLTEHNNFVVDVEDPQYADLKGRRLLAVEGRAVMTRATGPVIPGRGQGERLPIDGNNEAVVFMEWSNTIALLLGQQGKTVSCVFTEDESQAEILYASSRTSVKTKVRQMELRRIFEDISIDGQVEQTAVLARELARPGELTQGLCSPWQNDYRECACYYWAASRPDYVNVTSTPEGASAGDMWMQKQRTGSYLLDDRRDPRLLSYDDLFKEWEKALQFVVGGKDADESQALKSRRNDNGESL